MQIDGSPASPMNFCEWTTSQRELWPLQILEVDSASLNTGQFTEFFGEIDQSAFAEASRQAIAECDSLRIRIFELEDGPQLSIDAFVNWSPTFLDLSANENPRARAIEWMATELARPLDPQIQLFSWTLIKLGREHYIWCFIVHQLAMDGYSRNLVARRLSDFYAEAIGLPASEKPGLGPLRDLTREDAAYRSSEDFTGDQAYWTRLTADLPQPPRLTRKQSGGSYLCARHTSPLPAATASSMRQMMARTGVSLSGLFACLSAIYLHRLTGGVDIVVGLLVSARTNAALRCAPGNVSNTVPLRVRFNADTTLDVLLVQVRARIREALKHQRYPLSEMKAALPSLNGEMFAIAVNVMKFDYELEFGNVASVSHNLSNGPVDDLSISVFEQPGDDGLQIALNGNVARYTPAELKAHYDRLVYFLHELTNADTSRRIADIAYFPASERHLVLDQFNRTAHPLPFQSPIEMFEQAVKQAPESVAIVAGGMALTYGELDARANRLARHLISMKLGPGNVIAILTRQSMRVITSILAAWKCGAAFAQLTPDDPVARQNHVLKESGAVAVLADSDLWPQLESSAATPPRIIIDDKPLDELLTCYPCRPMEASERIAAPTPDALACLAFTAGSMAIPNAVEIVQSAVSNRLRWMAETFSIAAGETYIQKASGGFDPTPWDSILSLVCGATLIIAPENRETEPDYLREVIQRHAIGVLHIAPPLLSSFLRHDEARLCGSLKHIVASGDPLSDQLREQCASILPDATLWSLYGPAETTFGAAARRYGPGDCDSSTFIGAPIWNTRFLVLDQQFQPLPPSGVGNLFIAGEGLARGYAGNANLTNEQFIPCPFGGENARMFRTGDLASWRLDGTLELLGRGDNRIRLNGALIEPGEIEWALRQIGFIEGARVIARANEGVTRLIAYIKLKTGGEAAETATIRETLARQLPEPAIPSVFMIVDELPLGGEADIHGNNAPDPGVLLPCEQYVGPESPREELLCRLYREILGAPRISVNDNFFEIGGHSLLAARLAARISAETKTRVPLRAIFEHRTPGALARFLDARTATAPTVAGKPPLILFPGGGVLSREVVNLRDAISADFSVTLIDYPDWRDNARVFFDNKKYMADIVAQIQRAVPKPGPLKLIGYSFGAGVAYAMSILLPQLGYSIELLGIIDGRSPVLDFDPTRMSSASLRLRIKEFIQRDRSNRNKQLGRFIGMRAKRPVIGRLLRLIGPRLPRDESSELSFYLTAFINASVPMQAIRDWTDQLSLAERQVRVRSVLFRSKDNNDEWPVDLGWRPLIPALEIKLLPGTHITVIDDANLPAIRSCLTGSPIDGGDPATVAPTRSDNIAA